MKTRFLLLSIIPSIIASYASLDSPTVLSTHIVTFQGSEEELEFCNQQNRHRNYHRNYATTWEEPKEILYDQNKIDAVFRRAYLKVSNATGKMVCIPAPCSDEHEHSLSCFKASGFERLKNKNYLVKMSEGLMSIVSLSDIRIYHFQTKSAGSPMGGNWWNIDDWSRKDIKRWLRYTREPVKEVLTCEGMLIKNWWKQVEFKGSTPSNGIYRHFCTLPLLWNIQVAVLQCTLYCYLSIQRKEQQRRFDELRRRTQHIIDLKRKSKRKKTRFITRFMIGPPVINPRWQLWLPYGNIRLPNLSESESEEALR